MEEGRVDEFKAKVAVLEQSKNEGEQVNLGREVRLKELEMVCEQLQEEKKRLIGEIESNQARYKQNMDYFSTEKKKLTHSSGKKLRNYEHEIDRLKSSHEQTLAALTAAH